MSRAPTFDARPMSALLAVGLLAVAATPARAQQQPPPVERADTVAGLDVSAGETSVDELARRWADARGLVLQLDPQVTMVRVTFAQDAHLDARALRHVLDMHDVVAVERDGVLEVHHRRNLSQRVGPPWDYVEGRVAPGDRVVTAVMPVEHGKGMEIFTVIRALLTRDTNRIGNILFVQGPDTIVVVDLAHNVSYYQDLVAALDRPSPLVGRRMRLSVYEVDRAWWTKTREAHPTPAALAGAARGGGADSVSLLADAILHGAAPVALERDVVIDGLRTRVTLEVGGPPRLAKGDGEVVLPSSRDELHLRLRLDVHTESAAVLRLSAHTTFALGDAGPSVQSFTGRADERPTDVVVILERE